MSLIFKTEQGTDRWGDPKIKIVGIKTWVIIVPLILILLFNTFTLIPSGYTGVRTTFGQIDEEVIPNGLCFKIPFIQRIQKVNNKQQEINFKDQVWGETSERTVVFLSDATVTYKINPEYSAWLYANVTNYKQNALPATLVTSAFKASMVQLKSADVTNRGMIEPICVRELQEAINEKYNGEQVITIISVNIDNMDFEASYNTAIAEKQVAQMAYEKQQIQNRTAVEAASAAAEQQRIIAQAEADARLIAAEAEAEAITIEATAQAEANKKIAESLTTILIDYEKIDKWNGQMPTVTGSANSIISIDP